MIKADIFHHEIYSNIWHLKVLKNMFRANDKADISHYEKSSNIWHLKGLKNMFSSLFAGPWNLCPVNKPTNSCWRNHLELFSFDSLTVVLVLSPSHGVVKN